MQINWTGQATYRVTDLQITVPLPGADILEIVSPEYAVVAFGGEGVQVGRADGPLMGADMPVAVGRNQFVVPEGTTNMGIIARGPIDVTVRWGTKVAPPPAPSLQIYLSSPESAPLGEVVTVKWAGAAFSGRANLAIQQAKDTTFMNALLSPASSIPNDNLMEVDMFWSQGALDTYARAVDLDTGEVSNVMRFTWVGA